MLKKFGMLAVVAVLGIGLVGFAQSAPDGSVVYPSEEHRGSVLRGGSGRTSATTTTLRVGAYCLWMHRVEKG